MRIVCIANQKGGVGKTTTTANIGHGLARLGKRVLLVDLDPQANLTTYLLNGVASIQEKGITHFVEDCLHKGHSLAECVVPTGRENLWIAPTCQGMLADVANKLTSKMAGSHALLNGLQGLDYDVVLIDNGPSLGILVFNAIIAATDLLIPMKADFLSATGLSQILDIADESKSIRTAPINLLGICITQAQTQQNNFHDAVAGLEASFPGKLLPIVRINVRTAEGPGYTQTVYEYDDKRGDADYTAVCREVLRRFNGK